MGSNRAESRIDAALTTKPPGLWPFLAAGYPSLDATAAMLRALAALPIRGVELGFPFSDSIADGPVIQHAFGQALAGGVHVNAIFEMVTKARREIDYPLLAMVSASIVYRMGVEAFISRTATAGFDGLIVPDLSLEEAPAIAKVVAQAGLRLSMLIAPTTPPDRERQIADVASGFLYYVSVQGTTGERQALPADLPDHVGRIRKATGLPVLVGFGIGTPRQVQDVCAYSSGAIVGSAIVRRIKTDLDARRGTEQIVRAAVQFIAELAGAAPTVH
ncbi:MAG TPA: tryptophan synthase subunit alpha [Phycisphaerae bacterium]|nr:tryptophan synthase subunit alpha [Phycisphaerae bacterium]